MTSAPLPVTLCVCTRNEASRLPDCVTSCAGWVREVLVADMESEDDTVEVARKLGARVLPLPNLGFAEPGRQAAIEAAGQPWVLMLDADERARPGLRELVRESTKQDDLAGVWLPRQNILFGRWLRHTGYWPDYQLRLFRQEAVRWPARVHSYPDVRGPTIEVAASTENALLHYNYDRVSEWIERNGRYTSLEAEQLLADGSSPSLARLLAGPPREFASRYLRQRGYRDGFPGPVTSLLLALNVAMREAKLWRLART